MRMWVVLWVWTTGLTTAVTLDWAYDGTTFTLAHLNITYTETSTERLISQSQVGRYANGGVRSASGVLLSGRSIKGGPSKQVPYGCTIPWDLTIPEEPWIALVARGKCADKKKIMNAITLNATAIVIYSRDTRAHLRQLGLKSQGSGDGVAVVYVEEDKGMQLEEAMREGQKVWLTVTMGQPVKYHVTNINRTSVLFVSVSFIILMVISLAWLVFYYVQRFRYIHAKDRLARHLCNAAKKALANIPVKNLKASDRVVLSENDCCAICIEPYQVSETVRTLPCKHEFHKNCVDPWLLEHRTCPMCKMDILKFYGYVLSESEESVLQLDIMDDGPLSEVEAPSTTTPVPPLDHTNPSALPVSARNTQVSQVVVVPRDEGGSVECDDWSASHQVPNTPILPVHQPTPPPRSASPGLLSIVSRHPSPSPHTSTPSPAGFLSIVSLEHKGSVRQVAPMSSVVPCHHHQYHQATSTHPHTPPSSSAHSEARVTESAVTQVAGEGGEPNSNRQEVTGEGGGARGDVELTSVYSEEFINGSNVDEEQGVVAVYLEAGGDKEVGASTNPVCLSVSGATTTTPFLAAQPYPGPPSSPSVQPRPTLTHTPSATPSPTHCVSPSRRRSSSHSPSKKKPASRGRSRSRRRSGLQGRSASRSRTEAKRRGEQSGSASRGEHHNTRPSSHVISVTHV